MKLASTITSERGKPVTKTGNTAIRITLTENRQNKFDIIFNGDRIEVLCYWDGKVRTIDYTDNPCGHALCSPTICGNNLPF